MNVIRIVAVVWALYALSYGQTPVIEVLPATSVLVGEEVCFNGSGSTVGDPAGATYEWDFGDARSGIVEGAVVTHFYMRPGTFTATLTIDGASALKEITVTGNYTPLVPMAADPAVEMYFEDDLTDASGNGNNGAWLGSTGSYSDGVEHRALNVTGGAYATVPNFTGVNGAEGFTVTLWAQKGADDASGTIIALPGVFSIRTTASGDCMNGYVTSVSGSNSSQDWYFGGRDMAWHQYALVYDGSLIHLYCDGYEGYEEDRCPRALTGAAAAATGALHIGCNDGGSDGFNGYIDNVKIYDRVLTPEELAIGFELWHADFNGRLRAYVYTRIPGEITADNTNRLKVTLTGGTVDQTLVDKSDLASEEVFMVDRASLAQGEYLLTAQLLTSGGSVIYEIVEKVSKQYGGMPVCGLDENNSIRVNGELFFPITPWGLNDEQVPGWTSNGYINAVLQKGYWPTDASPSSWGNYMDIAQSAGIKAVGPSRWDNSAGSWENYSVADMTSYIDVSKNHPAQIIYHWGDEPDLKNVEGAPLRSQTFICHYEDPARLTGVNFAGDTWKEEKEQGYHKNQRTYNYNFLTNYRLFGKRTTLNDIYTLDYYPVEWAAPSTNYASFDILIRIMDRLKNENYNLVPVGGFVETCDINEPDRNTGLYPTPWHPTPAQLKMTIWINMVAGSRLLSWFHHHTATLAENLAVMADFVEDMGVLTPAILGPETAPGVSVTAPAGVRVEHMERIHEDTLYIFTVRVSESDTFGVSIGSTEDVTVNLPAGMSAASGVVYDESRTVSISGNGFTDSYGVNDVHIYKIPSSGLALDDYLPNRVINRPPAALANPSYREIRINGYGQGSEFTVYDAAGRVLGESRNGVVRKRDGTAFPGGVYLVKFENSNLPQRVILVQ